MAALWMSGISRYRDASVVTPNRQEAQLASGRAITSAEDAFAAGRALVERFHLGAAFVTLDRDGIAVVGQESGQLVEYLDPAQPQEVYDITGAGDMVVAITALCQAAELSFIQTAQLANVAAGLEIEQLGIAPVTWPQIERLCGSWPPSETTSRNQQPSPTSDLVATWKQKNKIFTLDEVASQVQSYRTANKTVVLTNGCFDLLHVGHVAYLQQAAELGDVLIVAINSDAGVRRLKGPDRPFIGAPNRAAMLAALACVDHVLIFDDDTPHRLLKRVRPDVLVKGGTTSEVVGREVVEAYGGRIHVTSSIARVSTTEIVADIRQRNVAISTFDKQQPAHT